MRSYGHTYLTSYGWSGTGTGLRNGAIAKPLAIPPKKNLSGLGKDRDEAFPFWDHLFTAASKAITIRVSSDDDEDAEDTKVSHIDLRRTTTGIISNRRPVSGTPASTSGNTTPTADAGLSLVATAKREAAKRGLYARFFRGPVLGPDDEKDSSDSGPSLTSHPTPDAKSKKRKSDGDVETKEARREQKRLKRERKAARAEKRARKALAGEEKSRLDSAVDRKEKKTRSEEEDASSKKTRKRTRKREQQDISCRSDADKTIVFTTKKKKAKRKDTS